MQKGNTLTQRADTESSAGSPGGNLVSKPGRAGTPLSDQSLQSITSDGESNPEPSPAQHNRPRCCSTVPQHLGHLQSHRCTVEGQKLTGFPCKAQADHAPEPTQLLDAPFSPHRQLCFEPQSFPHAHCKPARRCINTWENTTPL